MHSKQFLIEPLLLVGRFWSFQYLRVIKVQAADVFLLFGNATENKAELAQVDQAERIVWNKVSNVCGLQNYAEVGAKLRARIVP